jgi:hypothetical protein
MEDNIQHQMSENDYYVLKQKVRELKEPFATINLLILTLLFFFIIWEAYNYLEYDNIGYLNFCFFCSLFLLVIGIISFISHIQTKNHIKDLKYKKKLFSFLEVTNKYISRYGTYTTGHHYGVGSSVGYFVVFSTKKIQVEENTYEGIKVSDKVRVDIAFYSKEILKVYPH